MVALLPVSVAGLSVTSGSHLCHRQSRESCSEKLNVSDCFYLTKPHCKVMWQLTRLVSEPHRDELLQESWTENGVNFFLLHSVLSFLTHLMHRNQGSRFLLSCSLFSSSAISLGSWWWNSPPAPPALHSLPLIEQWATSLHYYRKLYFLPYGKMLWVSQLQAILETPGLVADF